MLCYLFIDEGKYYLFLFISVKCVSFIYWNDGFSGLFVMGVVVYWCVYFCWVFIKDDIFGDMRLGEFGMDICCCIVGDYGDGGLGNLGVVGEFVRLVFDFEIFCVFSFLLYECNRFSYGSYLIR